MIITHLTITLVFAVCTNAGQGGYVFLINHSGSDWKLMENQSYQMNSWKFPEELKDGCSGLVYLEFNEGIFIHSQDDYGKVEYELVGSGGKTFQIFARSNPFRIETVYRNIQIDGKPSLYRRNYGWKHNGHHNFILIKRNGTYTGTNLDGSNWMKDNIGTLGHRSLRKLCIPGSHDAGMSEINGCTAFAKECNVLTQTNSIKDQLELGIRYLDVRPVLSGSRYLTGHYSWVIVNWQGANGVSVDSIVVDINEFTSRHNELIIVRISHSLNTDVGLCNYRTFQLSEWNSLFNKLDNTNHLYHNRDYFADLREVTLNDFTKNGTRSAVLFIVDDHEVELGGRRGQGYFAPENLMTNDRYAGTNDYYKMSDDQIEKMNTNYENHFFILSWTLTQSLTDEALCRSKGGWKSLQDLAKTANDRLGPTVYQAVSSESFPNVIFVDQVQDTDVTALAMAINSKPLSEDESLT